MDGPKFPNEVELGYKFLNGDNEALGELYKIYYQPLILIAYKHLVDTEISKDVVCTVFEKLLQLQKNKREKITLHIQKGIYPYLVSMVKNKCLDHFKSTKLHDKIKTDIAASNSTQSPNLALVQFESENVNYILSHLSAREKQIMSLHLLAFKNEEIAKELIISYTTVRNTLHNAKSRLKRIWHLCM
jgi:RNA polymerase sigma factor (sigma-70 family)